MSNNTAGIFLKSNSDLNPNKYLFVYQRYYPGQKSYGNSKSFSYLLKDILIRLKTLNSPYTDEFQYILDKLNSSSLRTQEKILMNYKYYSKTIFNDVSTKWN